MKYSPCLIIFTFIKQNRVLKRLAKLETDRLVTVKKEVKKDTNDEILNNNVEPVKAVTAADKSASDPLQLPMPGDYDDYWYYGEDGEWYNEYDDELEGGYYYTKEKKLPSWCTDSSNAIPKPSDYEDYWYQADDGQWYNEYDDELLEGQYYVDKTDDSADAKKKKEEERIAEEKRKADEAKKAEEKRKSEDARKKAEEDARKAKEAAEKKAKEAARAAEEAAKKAQAEAKKMMSGFGGGLFGSSKPDQKKSSGSSLGLGGMFSNNQAEKKSPQKSPQPPAPAPAAQAKQAPAAAPAKTEKPADKPPVTEKTSQEVKPADTKVIIGAR